MSTTGVTPQTKPSIILDKPIAYPGATASIAGAVVIVSAALFGVLKTAVAAAIAYGAYRYLEGRKHEAKQPNAD